MALLEHIISIITLIAHFNLYEELELLKEIQDTKPRSYVTSNCPGPGARLG